MTIIVADKTYTTFFAANRARNEMDDPQAWDIVKTDQGHLLKPKAQLKRKRKVAALVHPNATRAAQSKRVPKKSAKKADSRSTWGQRELDAEAGKIPAPMDLSAPTRKYLTKHQDAIIALAKDGDVKALKQIALTDSNSNYKALGRFRDLCVRALNVAAKAS